MVEVSRNDGALRGSAVSWTWRYVAAEHTDRLYQKAQIGRLLHDRVFPVALIGLQAVVACAKQIRDAARAQLIGHRIDKLPVKVDIKHSGVQRWIIGQDRKSFVQGANSAVKTNALGPIALVRFPFSQNS